MVGRYCIRDTRSWEIPMKTTVMMAMLLAGPMLTVAVVAENVGSPLPHYIAAMTGDPEKDSFGYVAADLFQQPRATVLLSEEAHYVGLLTGDEEKDTFARVEVRPRWSADLTQFTK